MVRTLLAHIRAQWMPRALPVFLSGKAEQACTPSGTQRKRGSIGARRTTPRVRRTPTASRRARFATHRKRPTGSSRYAPNQALGSEDIINGQVKSADLAADSVNGGKLRDDSTASRHVLDSSLEGEDILDESLTGADVAESTLGQVPSAALGGIGRSACRRPVRSGRGGVPLLRLQTIVLPAPSRILVIGSVKAQPEAGADLGTGQCRLATNNGPIATSGLNAVGRSYNDKFVPLMAITDAGPGPLDFGIECNELDGYLNFFDARVIAVALSSN